MIGALARPVRLLLLAALLLGAFAHPTLAMRVSPLLLDMEPSGSAASSVIRVENPTESPIAVELNVASRMFDRGGEETQQPADDLFVIFPPQALIQPGATQSFRLQWVGEPVLAHTQSYLVKINQLPIALDQGDFQGVRLLLSFGALLHVSPKGAKPDIRTVAATPARTPDGSPAVNVTLENAGTRYVYLSQTQMTLRARGDTIAFSEADIRDVLGDSLLVPGGRRSFLLPVPRTLPPGDLSLTVQPND